MLSVLPTNVTAITAANNLNTTNTQMAKSLQRMSSGLRINSAADDASGFDISSTLNAQVRAYTVAQRNANDGISMVQTADGAAGQIQDMLTRMRELAVQANNGALTSSDKGLLNTEYQQLSQETDRVASATQFNGHSLLDGSFTAQNFQVGATGSAADQVTVSFGSMKTDALGATTDGQGSLANTNIQDDPAKALDTIDTALSQVDALRANLGANQSQFTSAINNLGGSQENTTSVSSLIQDADIAAETANSTNLSIRQQAAVSMMAQANSSSQMMLKLYK